MSQIAVSRSIAWAGLGRILAWPRVPRLGLAADVAGAVMVAILVGALTWTLEHRAVEMVLGELTARATDQARLAVLDRVEPTDLRPPFDEAKLVRLEARLLPLLELMRQPGSGIARINLYARDGTLVFGDRLSRRGERVSQADGPLLAQALEGRVVAERTTLSTAENQDLKAELDEALEVYIPLVLGGEVLGAYEVYEELGALPRVEPFIWLLAVTVGLLCGLCAALLRRVIGPSLIRRAAQPTAELGTALLVCEAGPGLRADSPALSRRELEVLSLLASTHSYREIAETLVVSEETVRTHVKRILRKLRQPDRTQAVVAAMRLGLLRLPEP